MSETKVIFIFEGVELTIQCTPEDKIRDICQKLSFKIKANFNLLVFLYGGKSMNMDLSFKEHANSLDKSNNIMRVLVYKKDVDDFICPHCGEKIKIKTEKIDEIISSIFSVFNFIFSPHLGHLNSSTSSFVYANTFISFLSLARSLKLERKFS